MLPCIFSCLYSFIILQVNPYSSLSDRIFTLSQPTVFKTPQPAGDSSWKKERHTHRHTDTLTHMSVIITFGSQLVWEISI